MRILFCAAKYLHDDHNFCMRGYLGESQHACFEWTMQYCKKMRYIYSAPDSLLLIQCFDARGKAKFGFPDAPMRCRMFTPVTRRCVGLRGETSLPRNTSPGGSRAPYNTLPAVCYNYIYAKLVANQQVFV